MNKRAFGNWCKRGMQGAGMVVIPLLLLAGTPAPQAFAASVTPAETPSPQAPAVSEMKFEIRQVYFRYIPEENFMRITEFFDGEENPGVRRLIRSTPEQRSGFYFVLRIKPGWENLQQGSLLRVHYVPQDAIHPVIYDFELGEEVRSWEGEIFFGLTGEQWRQEAGEPIAWKLEVLSPTGEVLAERDSFLWKDHPVREEVSE